MSLLDNIKAQRDNKDTDVENPLLKALKAKQKAKEEGDPKEKDKEELMDGVKEATEKIEDQQEKVKKPKEDEKKEEPKVKKEPKEDKKDDDKSEKEEKPKKKELLVNVSFLEEDKDTPIIMSKTIKEGEDLKLDIKEILEDYDIELVEGLKLDKATLTIGKELVGEKVMVDITPKEINEEELIENIEEEEIVDDKEEPKAKPKKPATEKASEEEEPKEKGGPVPKEDSKKPEPKKKETKPKDKPKNRKEKVFEEEVDGETKKTVVTQLPTTSLDFGDCVARITPTIPDDEWNAFTQKIEEEKQKLVIPPDMTTADMSMILSHASNLRLKLSNPYAEYKNLYDTMASRETDGLIRIIKKLNAEGSNKDQRDRFGIEACMNYQDINLYELFSVIRKRYYYIKESYDFVKDISSLMITSSGNLKLQQYQNVNTDDKDFK